MNQALPDNPAAFEPSQLAELVDPYSMFRALHAAGPSLRTASGIHCVVGYAAADAILREPRFRSGPIAQRFRQLLPAGAARDELSHRINFLDPPDHPRVRGLVSCAFTPRRVRDLQPFVARKAEELLDADNEQRASDPTIDLRASLAHPLPSRHL